MQRVLVISFTDLARDPRVDRQLRQLTQDFEVVAAGTGAPALDVQFVGLDPLFTDRAARARFQARLATRRHERTYWSQRAIRSARERLERVSVDLVVANELESLPLALELGPPVLFDAHEYSPLEFEDSARWRRTWGPYVRHLCAVHIPRVSAMSTVSPGIAERYEREYGVSCHVVRNMPAYADLEPSAVGDQIRLVHHGGADRSRRLEAMIEVVRMLDERFSLDFVLTGNPSYQARLRRLAASEPRIRFLEPVPMQELVGLANRYDVGLYLLDPGAFNRRHALPNKLFEFIQARLAVAIGPSPEMARIVREWDLGVVADDFAAESVARALRGLGAAQVARYKQNAAAAAQGLSAEAEMAKFTALVAGLAGR